ncbi:MAG: hypothetical protein KDH84_05245, partial [Calditrichaeota bacterium]|nr:hypothetical protein [Calditrichota bacterium]
MAGSNPPRHTPEKPGILFVTPVFPDITGYGLAMRAGALLEALAAYGAVHVLVIPVYDPGRKVMPEIMRPFCSACSVMPVSRADRAVARMRGAARVIFGKSVNLPGSLFATTRLQRRVEQICRSAELDYIYIFRLYMVPFVRACLARNALNLKGRFIDIDDIESRTRSGIA